MNLDFIWSLNDHINDLNLFAPSNVGVLGTKDSMSVLASPGGIASVFYDGSRDQDYNVQFTAKSKNQQLCVEALNAIMDDLLFVSDIPSLNESYDFGMFVIQSPPSVVAQDEQGYFIWQLSATAKLTIYKGAI